jgi:hypothetical protein
VPTAVFDGGGAATVHVRLAGVSSTLPAPSIARTWSVYVPRAMSGSASGESQPANGAPSSEHSNSTSSSFDENVIVTSLLIVVPAGPESMVV